MEDFIKKYSKVPNNFVSDFFNLSKESYKDTDFVIDFDKVVVWLKVRKDNLKRLLVSNFEENYDYSITKIKNTKGRSRGANYKEKITLTPDCFKELCMISQTSKAKEVRKYYLTIEKLIKKYHEHIQDSLRKELNLTRVNQKPKVNSKKGVIYIIKANNTNMNSVYKIGRSTDIKKRLSTYNSGNANDIEPLFIIDVENIDIVEGCIKNLVKKHQYRKYKEVYEIDIDVLKYLVNECDEFVNGLKDYISGDKKKKKQLRSNINKIKKNENGVFIYIDKYTQ